MIWQIIVTLLVGSLCGWITARLMNLRGGCFRNVIIGLLGSAVGSAIAGLFGLYADGWLGSIILSVLGACLCVFIARRLFKK